MFKYITHTGLSSAEVDYWRRMFLSNLKIAVEIECEYVIYNSVISNLTSALQPTHSYKVFGECGVSDVKGDGSLRGGAEITTVGRRLSFLDLYEQYKFIVSQMMQYEPKVNSRAGLHNHVLLDYTDNSTSLEKNVPEIIMKNFLQLLKKYAPALIWITSTIKSRDSSFIVTRGKNFCDHDTLMSTAVTTRSMSSLKNTICNGTRYKFINLNPLTTVTNEDIEEIKRFHFELRFPDCSIFPAQIAAQNILYAALLIKAVELSYGGVIGCSDSEADWNEIKECTNAIRTSYNDDDRNSAPLAPSIMDTIKARALQMVQELKPQIFTVDRRAYPVLMWLAETPISRSEHDYGHDIRKINDVNQSLDNLVSNMYGFYSREEEFKDIINSINSMEITNRRTEKLWCCALADVSNKNISDIESKIFQLKTYRNLIFDVELGTYIFR